MALRWSGIIPSVVLLLSGMNEESHIEENLRIAGEALPNSLTADEKACGTRSDKRQGDHEGQLFRLRLLHALPGRSQHPRGV